MSSTSRQQTTASRLSRSRNTETIGTLFRSSPTSGVVSSFRYPTSSVRGRSNTSSSSSSATRTSTSVVASRTSTSVVASRTSSLQDPAATALSSTRVRLLASRAGLRNVRASSAAVTEGDRGRSTVTMTTSLAGVRLNTTSLQKVQPRRSARLQSSPIKETPEKEADTVLKSLPSINHQKCTGRSSSGENVFYCPICFENIKNIGGRTVVLPCGHVFCRDCLFAIFQKKKKCPLCQVAFHDFNAMMEIFL